MKIRFIHLMVVAALVALLPTSANAFMRYGGGGGMHYGGGGMHSMPQGYPMQNHGMSHGGYEPHPIYGPPRGEVIVRHGPPIERFGVVRGREFGGAGVVFQQGGYGGGIVVEQGGYGGGEMQIESHAYERHIRSWHAARGSGGYYTQAPRSYAHRAAPASCGCNTCNCNCCNGCGTVASGPVLIEPPAATEVLTPSDYAAARDAYQTLGQ